MTPEALVMVDALEPRTRARSSAAAPSWSSTRGARVAETGDELLIELLALRRRHALLRGVSLGAMAFLAFFLLQAFQEPDATRMLLALGVPVGIATGLEWMGRRALRQRGRELGVREEVVAELVHRTRRAPWRDPATVLAELRARDERAGHVDDRG